EVSYSSALRLTAGHYATFLLGIFLHFELVADRWLDSHCSIRQLVCVKQAAQVYPSPALAIDLRREVQSQSRWREPRHPPPETQAQVARSSDRVDGGGRDLLLRASTRRTIYRSLD